MAKAKPRAAERTQQRFQETPFEAECRKEGGFDKVEGSLPERWTRSELGYLDSATSLLGLHNPFAKKADPRDNNVWLLDNTAYRPIHPYPHAPQPWQAEFVACYFVRGRKDISDTISSIMDQIGLDGQLGTNEEAKKRIEERLLPFVAAVAPARSVQVRIPLPPEKPEVRSLGPGNSNGISAQTVLTGGGEELNGTSVKITTVDEFEPPTEGMTHFAGPDGWAICSDIDDTIKVTGTSDAVRVLRTTFADIPEVTEGMPEFYKTLQETFQNPAWFYLSASPYNLYPFLRKFLREHYSPGTLILRDNSWMFLGGLLRSLTQGVQAYKVDRMNHIHGWLPNRKFICIGDSTQSDPEAYAEIYKKYKGWVRAIYIRKVIDIPNMEKKNEDERFKKAFEGVPADIWRVFVNPSELADHVKGLAQQ